MSSIPVTVRHIRFGVCLLGITGASGAVYHMGSDLVNPKPHTPRNPTTRYKSVIKPPQ